MAEDIEEIVKREVAAAREILRSDGIIASNKALKEKLDRHFPDDPEPNPDAPQPPKKKDEPEKPDTPERKPGLWWGDSVA